MWMPDIPHDQGTQPQGTIKPVGVVAHRTYGSWNGDYSVGKGSNPPVGFHFLVGKAQGKWVQFYDTTTRCAHGGSNANANDVAVGIEVEGRNEDVMTDWQVSAVRRIVDWLYTTHGIAKVYRYGTAHNSKADHGYLPHSAVAGSDHSDYWTEADWARIIGAPVPPQPGPPSAEQLTVEVVA
jgi:N-acetyl-anhydromuramyl-L-alanine amidase AmpD